LKLLNSQKKTQITECCQNFILASANLISWLLLYKEVVVTCVLSGVAFISDAITNESDVLSNQSIATLAPLQRRKDNRRIICISNRFNQSAAAAAVADNRRNH